MGKTSSMLSQEKRVILTVMISSVIVTQMADHVVASLYNDPSAKSSPLMALFAIGMYMLILIILSIATLQITSKILEKWVNIKRIKL